MTKLDEFSDWAAVPDHLKTRTGWKRQGRRPVRGAKPHAFKTHWHYNVPTYDLYHFDDTEQYTLSEKQRAAIRKARKASLRARTCTRCGYVANLNEYTWNKGITVYEGFCKYCRQEVYEEQMAEEAHLEAIRWADKMMNTNGVLFLDTETTGLEGEVIEIAVINVSESYYISKRLNPILDVEPEATQINGLTNEMLKDEPRFPDIYEGLKKLLIDAPYVVIYNAPFDVARIQQTCELHGLEPFEFNATCAMRRYAEFLKSDKWQPLYGGDHTALGDCKATARLVQLMSAPTGELENGS
ncbi:MAG: 3'-5' exonuclease [Anaerolineales bacterium]|nr:3'-5' exonuclease [Anaerolineales bacterium]